MKKTMKQTTAAAILGLAGACALITLTSGCGAARPLRPGAAMARLGAGTNGMPMIEAAFKQPENPAQNAMQTLEKAVETELPLAPGTRVVERVSTVDDAGKPVSREQTIVLTEPSVRRSRTVEKVGTTIGPAQKDTARELGVRLKAMWPAVLVGLSLFMAGGVLLYQGWWTKGGIAIGLGVLLLVLSQAIPQYGAWLALGVLLLFGLLAFLVMYVYARGQLEPAGVPRSITPANAS